MGHPPSRIDPTTGFRTYDGDVESEAYGVGGAPVSPGRVASPADRLAAGRRGER